MDIFVSFDKISQQQDEHTLSFDNSQQQALITAQNSKMTSLSFDNINFSQQQNVHTGKF